MCIRDRFTTAFYLYVDTQETQCLEAAVKEMLGAMKAGLLQFGAKKSSGAGKIIPVSVKERSFLMSKEQDRKAVSYTHLPKVMIIKSVSRSIFISRHLRLLQNL